VQKPLAARPPYHAIGRYMWHDPESIGKRHPRREKGAACYAAKYQNAIDDGRSPLGRMLDQRRLITATSFLWHSWPCDPHILRHRPRVANIGDLEPFAMVWMD
jgi:hypothetical protein